MLRRLKGLGANLDEMLEVYEKQIRCVLEMAVAVWEPGLTQCENKQIERVQRSAFSVILGDEYHSYENALTILDRKRLSERRYDLCLKFSKKASLHQKYQNWFSYNPDISVDMVNTRTEKPKLKYKPVKTRTRSYKKSPLSYLTEILNTVKK